MEQSNARRATYLIMAMFLLQALPVGGWLALIPLVKEDLGLSKAELAVALMGTPLALIPGLQVAGRVMTRYGPRRVFMAAFPLQAIAVMLPLLAWSGPSLFAAMALLSAVMAFIEVGTNVYAGRLEKQAGLLIMNRCHGFWALGLAGGSAFVTALPQLPPVVPLATLAVAAAAAAVPAARAMPRLRGEQSAPPPRRRLAELPRALVLISAFMLMVVMLEGAIADWSAVYLAERLGDPSGRAGIAVAIFSAFMAGGRFAGDWMKARLGAVALARVTTLSAMAGLLSIVLPLPIWFAYLGFALAGFGVSTAYPLGASAVAALDDRYESPNIAFMATVALGGFLMGPPMIGFVAEWLTLSAGLATLLPGMCLALWLTRWLAPRVGGHPGTESSAAPANPAVSVEAR